MAQARQDGPAELSELSPIGDLGRIQGLELRPEGGFGHHGRMGWDALEQWGEDAVRLERLSGGVANDVWTVRVNGALAVARLGRRSHADLAWETALLLHLDREGLIVPVPIPTSDGRPFADGLVVST